MNLIDWFIDIFRTRQTDNELNDNDFSTITGTIVGEKINEDKEA